MDAGIEADGLIKRFDGRAVVDGVSFTVPRGQIFGFLGQNGAGKTTTLRMLLGILDPDGGVRRILGDDNPLRQSHRVGYLPEERGLYPAMQVREVIAYFGALRGLPLAEGRRRADALLDDHSLGAHKRARVRDLSKGMAQKVQLLATLVHQPELIVLDEPFSGLDPINQQELESLIRAQTARGATILFSTHVMAHAQQLCDELVIIAKGKTRFQGSVDDARQRLPLRVNLATTHPVADGLLPAGAVQDGAGYQFDLPPEGIEPTLQRLLASGAGLREFTVERPTLHDAFVAIVGDDAQTDREGMLA